MDKRQAAAVDDEWVTVPATPTQGEWETVSDQFPQTPGDVIKKLDPITRFAKGVFGAGDAPNAPMTDKVAKPLETYGRVAGGPIGAFAGRMGGDVLRETVGRVESGDYAGAAGAGVGLLGPKLLLKGAEMAGLVGKAGRAFKKSAETGYYQALHPTKEGPKYLAAEKVVPEMLKRKVTGNLDQLAAKAQAGMEAADLSELWDKIPDEKTIDTKPLLTAMDDAIARFQVPGEKEVNVPASKILDPSGKPAIPATTKTVATELEPIPTATDNLRKIRGVIADLGDKVSPHTLRKTRQMWDTEVARTGGYSGRDQATVSLNFARREGSNAIRHELAKAIPDLEKANAEFTLWKRLGDIVEATKLRKTGQVTPLTETIMTGSGLVAGGLSGGMGGAAMGALALKEGAKIVRSPGWKTFTAVQRQKVADRLAEGNISGAWGAYIAGAFQGGKTAFTTRESQ